MGMKYELLNDINMYDGVSFNSLGALEIEGCRSHFCIGSAFFISIGRDGMLYVGVLKDDNVLYFTNNNMYKENPIIPILNFAKWKEAASIIPQ